MILHKFSYQFISAVLLLKNSLYETCFQYEDLITKMGAKLTKTESSSKYLNQKKMNNNYNKYKKYNNCYVNNLFFFSLFRKNRSCHIILQLLVPELVL